MESTKYQDFFQIGVSTNPVVLIHKGSNVAIEVSTFNMIACLVTKTKVECMQFMPVLSKFMIGNMVATDFPGYHPFDIFCV